MKKPYFFISYRVSKTTPISTVCHCLVRMANIEYYFHEEKKKAGEFTEQLKKELEICDTFILFLSKDSEDKAWQTEEVTQWLNFPKHDTSRLVIVEVGKKGLPPLLPRLINVQTEFFDLNQPDGHINCAKSILELLAIPFAPFDDLPTIIDAKYEKEIINSYKEGIGLVDAKLIRKGYPKKWPEVKNFQSSSGVTLTDNPLNQEKYGNHRDVDASIYVDARVDGQKKDLSNQQPLLTFPEAGPRKKIVTPPNTLNVAILVSGGIAPGINAVINAIIDRHSTYEENYRKSGNDIHRVVVHGCIEGFKSVCRIGGHFKILTQEETIPWANRGGSLLPTSRETKLLSNDPVKRDTILKSVTNTLIHQEINVLYVIGGEGSMRGAHAILTVFKRLHPSKNLSVIGIPKTMDNDILWAWQSFGFLSAIEKARHDILQLSTEVTSNPRVGIMQLFGSSSGFVVSHAALGSNVCDLVLIPEMKFTMSDVCSCMGKKLTNRKNAQAYVGLTGPLSPWGLIVMAETAIPIDFEKYYNKDYVGLSQPEKNALDDFKENKRIVTGQTLNELRSAGLKLVSQVLQKYINRRMGFEKNDSSTHELSRIKILGEKDDYWTDFKVFCNEPRHLIRSMEPNVNDVAFASRLGTMAVDMALSGHTDCMVSQWLTEYVAVPLKLVVLGRKQMPKEGIFWKTVISKTKQIEYSSLS